MQWLEFGIGDQQLLWLLALLLFFVTIEVMQRRRPVNLTQVHERRIAEYTKRDKAA